MLKVLTKFKTKKKGFTLIELMSVIGIILILAAVLIPKAEAQRNSAKDLSASVTNLNRVNGAMMSYFSQSKTWATNDSKPGNIVKANLDYDPTLRNMITIGAAEIIVIPQVATTGSIPNTILPENLSSYTGNAEEFETAAINRASETNCAAAFTGTISPIGGAGDLAPGTIVIDSYINGMVIYGIDHNGNIVNPQMIK